MTNSDRPTVAMSSCLCGNPVRYDGNHKRQEWLHDSVLHWVEPLVICPEAGAGLGVPRPAVHLVLDGGKTRMIGVSDPRLDVTEQVRGYVEQLMHQLAHVDAVIVKARSPSCALRDAPRQGGLRPPAVGPGLFTHTLRQHNPLLPVEDEETLRQTERRRAFFDQVFLYRHARIAGVNPGTDKRQAFLRTAQSALAIRAPTVQLGQAAAAIRHARENPQAPIAEELLASCLLAVADPRSGQYLQHYLSNASNWREFAAPERVLRFGL